MINATNKQIIQDLLEDNKRMFTTINAYSIVVKDKTKKLLTQVSMVVDSVHTTDYLVECKQLYIDALELVRVRYTCKCMYNDIQENLEEIKRIRQNGGK